MDTHLMYERASLLHNQGRTTEAISELRHLLEQLLIPFVPHEAVLSWRLGRLLGALCWLVGLARRRHIGVVLRLLQRCFPLLR